MNMENLEDRVRRDALFAAALEKVGGSMETLAERLGGYSKRTLHRVLIGETKLSRPLTFALEAVAKGDTVGQRLRSLSLRETPPSGAQEIPLLSWVQAGQFSDYQEIPRSWEKMVTSDCPDPQAFALTVRGDSMEPKIFEGDVVVVAPSRKAELGTLVVARDINDGVNVKLFTMDGENVQLSSYNTAYPPIRLPEERFVWIKPVYSLTRYF